MTEYVSTLNVRHGNLAVIDRRGGHHRRCALHYLAGWRLQRYLNRNAPMGSCRLDPMTVGITAL
jgi:hypothetical protein